MSSHYIECPICFKNFSSDFIEIHAQSCKRQPDESTDSHGLPTTKKAKLSSSNQTFFSPKSKVSFSKDSLKSQKAGNTARKQTSAVSKVVNAIRMSGTASKQETNSASVPLAERSRPATFEDYVGQEQVMGQGCILNELLKNDVIPSMILWGPPGCGKTSLAHVIATKAKTNPKSSMRFVKLSATNSGKADVIAAVEAAKNDRRMMKRKTILFIDEIHRFNKLQQDAFLPHVEDGTIILIGATTENPSFSLNSALLSRCRVIVLEKLSIENVKSILLSAIKRFEGDVKVVKNKSDSCDDLDDEKVQKSPGSGDVDSSPDCQIIGIPSIQTPSPKITISEEAITSLAGLCDGDARTAINGLQMAIQMGRSAELRDNNNLYHIDLACIKKSLHRSHVLYDRTGDQHYEIISAFHKSIRGCDANATLYWLARMLEGGEDPKYIARRLIRIASEDIGLGDSNALNLAVSTQQACQFIGMPECDVVLAHCAVYLANAPKNPSVYLAYRRAKETVKNHEGPLPGVPLHLRNASTKLMKELGYGRGYQYCPADNESQTYLPQSLLNCDFFSE